MGDRRQALVAIENRWNHGYAFVHPPDNGCFAGSAQRLQAPVDVRGRDESRAWISSGTHVVSIELATKKTLRTWDLDGCAMQIVAADSDAVTVAIASVSGDGYVMSLERVDRAGVHTLDRYGHIDGLNSGAELDRFGRLWWLDSKAGAFVCRTPVTAS
ncbi:MAG: hypothetical protein JO199_04745 [Candidatus Eremiobacteraeota bacterium]|nr:hypothetical protein [Candidatus Eremiobacteraeota bacterium]